MMKYKGYRIRKQGKLYQAVTDLTDEPEFPWGRDVVCAEATSMDGLRREVDAINAGRKLPLFYQSIRS